MRSEILSNPRLPPIVLVPVEILLSMAYFIQFLKALYFSFRKRSWSSIQSVINQPASAERLWGSALALWSFICELTEIIFLNGIKSEGELRPGQYSVNLADHCLGVTSPTEYILSPYWAPTEPQAQRFCLHTEEADDASEKLGPHFKKAFDVPFFNGA